MSSDASLESAQAQDAADPLSRLRAAFHVPATPDGRPVTYLCGNSLGLQPRRAMDEVAKFMQEWQQLGVLGYHDPGADWLNLHERLAPTAAALAGAQLPEVVVMHSLTINLHLLMASFYRPTRERHRILIEQNAFPSDRYAVASQLEWHGYGREALVQVAARPGQQLLQEDDIAAAIEREGGRLALVLLPGVQYLTGQRLDLARLIAAAHRVGAVAGLDLAHAMGNVPLALHDWGADFAAWCSYKYLNGGPGATAGAFVHERHFDAGLPKLAGWWGNELATRFDFAESMKPYRGAAGWQVSNHPLLGMVPLLASFPLFDEAGMGALAARSRALTGYLERQLDERLGARIEILTPRDPARRGAQLSVRLAGSRGGGRALFDGLISRGLTCDWREPDVIRLAPAPLYNSYEDCWRAVSIVEDALNAAPA
ncbi:MAG: kynureninase [Steroidobacteraceae bacterium]|nr:kynureninase [Steroidobacteraceae bacterium]